MKTKVSILAAQIALITAATLGSASAVTSVTALAVSDVNTGSSTTRTGITDLATPTPNTYTVVYNGVERRIDSLTTSGGTYVPTNFGSAFARRNTAPTTFPTDNANQTAAYNSVNTISGLTHTVEGRYLNTMENLFTSRNILTGTENLFVNTAAGANVLSNVERMDFTFSTPFAASNLTGFSVFERGRGPTSLGSGANGGFKMAAITAVDAFGVPTAFGNTIVSIVDDSYNNGGVGTGQPSLRYDVFRFGTSGGPELDVMHNVNIGPQGIAGVMVLTSDLVPVGTQIYGYAVFGEDVTATNGSQLVDVTNPTFYPTNSGFVNDVDMVATGATLYTNVIPEPSVSLLTFALLGLGLARRSRR